MPTCMLAIGDQDQKKVEQYENTLKGEKSFVKPEGLVHGLDEIEGVAFASSRCYFRQETDE